MRVLRGLPLLATLLLVAACQSFTVGYKQKEAHSLASVADPFQQTLFEGYNKLADEQYGENDYWNSDDFYRKAIAAARGEEVGPEDPERWTLTDADRQQVVAMRQQVVAFIAANKGANPQAAAREQLSFDCWIEELSEKEYGDAEMCKPKLGIADRGITGDCAANPDGRDANGRLCQEAVIYFAFDRYDLLNPGEDKDRKQTAAAQAQVLDLIVRQARTLKPARIDIVGRADAAGPEDYNYGLSECRAQAVATELKKRGLPPVEIRSIPLGKTDLVVPTADGVRDPANRVVMLAYQSDAGAPLAHQPAAKPKKDLFGCGTKHKLPPAK
jgi:OOP family OmpA-OmpF porin